MNLKIKTKDIEIDYADEYSLIEEDSKKRIIEIIQEMRKLPAVSAFDAFGDPRKHFLSGDPKVDDPMWFIEQQPLNKDIKLGYSQAVYQIRLMLSSKDEQVNGSEVRKYTEFMISELNKIELNK